MAQLRLIEARWALLWVVLVVALAIAGVATARLLTARALPDVGAVPAGSALGPPTVRPVPIDQPPSSGTPTRLILPGQDVVAAVVPVDVRSTGELVVPDDPRVLGWWRGGARPGDQRGTVVIDGHVDTWRAGAGALFRLAALQPGERVALDTSAGPRHYVVRAVRGYPKSALPAEVFDTTGPPRLVLITCGGAFNSQTRQYADNIVAYAVPVPS